MSAKLFLKNAFFFKTNVILHIPFSHTKPLAAQVYRAMEKKFKELFKKSYLPSLINLWSTFAISWHCRIPYSTELSSCNPKSKEWVKEKGLHVTHPRRLILTHYDFYLMVSPVPDSTLNWNVLRNGEGGGIWIDNLI